jgi:hypothetical protein
MAGTMNLMNTPMKADPAASKFMGSGRKADDESSEESEMSDF